VRLDTVLLAEAATVRDGLLNVLSGGITYMERPEFPTPLNLTLVLRVMFDDPQDAIGEQTLNVTVSGEEGEPVAGGKLSFEVARDLDTRGLAEAGFGVSGGLLVPLSYMLLPEPGRYRIDVADESGERLGGTSFAAALPGTLVG
jgi:hypothetical protein